MKLLTALCFSYCLFFSLSLSGQSYSEMTEFFEDAQYFFNRGEYEEAAYYYMKLVNKDPDNCNFNYKLGETYLNIPGKEPLAIPYFEKSLKYLKPKNSYEKKSFGERGAPVHALFYLGNAYRINNQLDKALEMYARFTDSPFFYGNYNQNIVETEIASCERAKIIQDAPVSFEKTFFGSVINSDFTEEKPVISGDGKTLVFVRRLQFYDAIFCSRKIGDDWQQAVNINPQIVSDGDYYPTGLSSDGKTLLLVKKIEETYDIYYSVFNGLIWEPAKKFNNNINSLANEIHASFGKDDKTIYLTSDRTGGRGGYDIYVVELVSADKWSRPKNLGKAINTSLNEQDANFSADYDVLFFSSQGQYTMGGYDIFYTRKAGKKWQQPLNIGFPINTTGDNLFYTPLKDNCREAVISIENGPGNKDICTIRITSLNTLNFQPSHTGDE